MITIEGRHLSALLDVALASNQEERLLLAVARRLPRSGVALESNSLRPAVLTFLDLRALAEFKAWRRLMPDDLAHRLAAIEKQDSPSGRVTPLNTEEATAMRAKLGHGYPQLDFTIPARPPPRRPVETLNNWRTYQ